MRKNCTFIKKNIILLNFIIIVLIPSCKTDSSDSEYNNANRYNNVYLKYQTASLPLVEDNIKHYVYFAGNREGIIDNPFLNNKRFEGAQIKYKWKEIEPEKDLYDFSKIWEDYNYLHKFDKKIWIQLQDATFNPKYNPVPDYLLSEENDGGSVESLDEGKLDGWVAKRWNANVQYRFSLLLNALGEEFDGKIGGINLQETALEVSKKDNPTFNPEIYSQSIKIRMSALKEAFPNTITLQNANFMPGEWLPWEDKGYLRSIYDYGEEIGVGLSAPDLMVQNRGQLNHALAMMYEGNFSVPLGISVQDGNYIGKTNTDKVPSKRENIVPMLHAFAKDFLNVEFMFWSYQEPFYSEDLLPCFQTSDQ